MNVLDFKESLTKTLERVPQDAELVLGSIAIPVSRNGAIVGRISISENQTSYLTSVPVMPRHQELRAEEDERNPARQ